MIQFCLKLLHEYTEKYKQVSLTTDAQNENGLHLEKIKPFFYKFFPLVLEN